MSLKTGHKRHVLYMSRNFHAPRRSTDESIESFLFGINTPRSLAAYLLYEAGTPSDHQQLLGLSTDPHHYNDAGRFRDDYLVSEFLSKSVFLNTQIDKKAVAFTKFFEFEDQCKRTNNRFRNLSLDPLYNGSNASLLHAMTLKIDRLLGDFCPDEFFDSADWGPGVSTLLKGTHVSAYNKFHEERGITRDLYSLVGESIRSAYPCWYVSLTRPSGSSVNWPTFQVGNSIVTVPKNSKTDRVIAIEPGVNLWFQKAIGSMIRRRLLREGVNLQDQTRNQRLALSGSTDGYFATIDFSSASDSIARKLVEELIPLRWLTVMQACRSPFGIYDGQPIRWEKFSSMGNGFTFELESLIFWAAAKVVQESLGIFTDVSVFGDDVIIASSAVELFSSFSGFLGFTVNSRKSFSSSYFRESCGSHYFDGVDCKPIYLKERLSHVKTIYKLANSIRLLAHRRHSYNGCDAKFLDTWVSLFQRLPGPLRLRCTYGLGDDVGFISNWDESSPSTAPHGWEGYTLPILVDLGVKGYSEEHAMLCARLSRKLSDNSERDTVRTYKVLSEGSTQGRGNSFDLRGRTQQRLITVVVQQWYNLGMWK